VGWYKDVVPFHHVGEIVRGWTLRGISSVQFLLPQRAANRPPQWILAALPPLFRAAPESVIAVYVELGAMG